MINGNLVGCYSKQTNVLTSEGIYPISAITEIEQNKFKNNTVLTGINMPSITTMGTYAFSNCTTVKTIILPSVSTVTAYSMDGCTALETADFATATAIASGYTFRNCSALKALILRSATRVNLTGNNCFGGSGIAAGTGYIYVPKALLSGYQTATNWSTYSNQFRAIEDYPAITGG